MFTDLPCQMGDLELRRHARFRRTSGQGWGRGVSGGKAFRL